jgi:hypothetical protein
MCTHSLSTGKASQKQPIAEANQEKPLLKPSAQKNKGTKAMSGK